MPAEYCGQVGITCVSAVGVVRVLQADGVRARYLCAAVAGRGGRRSRWVVRLDAIQRGRPGALCVGRGAWGVGAGGGRERERGRLKEGMEGVD